MTRIYLSYRPEDSSAKEAAQLYTELVQVHGEHAVRRTPRQEDRIVTQIQDDVNACQVVIVLIGSYWGLIVDEHGRSVLEDRYDPIHVEIATALESNKQILPVLVDNAKMPAALDLPLPLRRLTAVIPVSLRTGQQFEKDAKKLATGLRKPSSIITAKKQASVPAPRSSSRAKPLMVAVIAVLVAVYFIVVMVEEENSSLDEVAATVVVPVTEVPLLPEPTETNTARYRSDGLTLSDKAIVLDTAEGLATQARLPAHSNGVNTVAFSPDGSLLATGGGDGLVKIWSINSMISVESLPLQNWPIAHIDFGPAGNTLAFSSYTTLVYYDLRNERSTTYPLPIADTFVAFNPNSAALVSGWTDTSVAIWDTSGGTITTKEPVILDTERNISVRTAVFSPDGSRLLVGEAEGRIQVWDLNKSGHILTAAHESAVTALTFNGDGSQFAAASDEGTIIRIWDIETLRLLNRFEGIVPVSDIAFSVDGSLLFAAGEDGILYLWDVAEGTYVTVKADSESLNGLALSPDGVLLATAGESLQIWGEGG